MARGSHGPAVYYLGHQLRGMSEQLSLPGNGVKLSGDRAGPGAGGGHPRRAIG